MRLLCHFLHGVSVNRMERKRYDCHVWVLIARKPCLRAGKVLVQSFWPSPVVAPCYGTFFFVIVCFSCLVCFVSLPGFACSLCGEHDHQDEECETRGSLSIYHQITRCHGVVWGHSWTDRLYQRRESGTNGLG